MADERSVSSEEARSRVNEVLLCDYDSVCCCRRVSSPARGATSEQVSLVPIFLFKKISHLLHCSSFFVKRLARLTCSFVNALTTVRCHYHLFTSVPSAQKWHLNHSAFPKRKGHQRVSFYIFI